MHNINLGKDGTKNVMIDLDVLIRTRLLIQANSGGGKSYLLRRMVEQAFGKIQIIFIDPEGEFPTLREKFDFVLVGKGGETPADVRSAGMLAHKLLELNVSAVCDLFEMKMPQRHLWVKNFLEALIDAPKKLWHPVLIIVDEAHLFCPEKGAGESEASNAMIDLATRGRKRGFCAVWATQRLGKLRKDAASELQNVLIGGTFIDIDRERAANALGIPTKGAERQGFFDKIKLMEPGNFFALGRAISIDRVLVKVGGVVTTHPEPGSSKRVLEPTPPTQKIKDLLPQLSDLPKEAEKKERTEAELRIEVQRLGREVTRLEAEGKRLSNVQVKPEIVYRDIPYVPKELLEGMDRVTHKVISAMDEMRNLVTTHSKSKMPPVPVIRQEPIKALAANRIEYPIKQKVERASAVDNTKIGEGVLKILTLCAQYPDGITKRQLITLSGYKARTVNAYLRENVNNLGTIEIHGQMAQITDSGFALLGDDFTPLPTGDDLLQYWLANLPEGEEKILRIVTHAYPGHVTKSKIEEETGYKPRTINAYLRTSLSRRLLDVSGSRVTASPDLFS